jgi:hypothetical protein
MSGFLSQEERADWKDEIEELLRSIEDKIGDKKFKRGCGRRAW